MSLLDVVRLAPAIADKVTKPLQPNVVYERDIGNDGFGTRTFSAPVPLRAIVDFTSAQVRTKDGILTVTRATILLLDIAAIVAATNGEGVSDTDRFTLPDGDTGPVLDIAGFIDAGTGHPIATTVMLG